MAEQAQRKRAKTVHPINHIIPGLDTNPNKRKFEEESSNYGFGTPINYGFGTPIIEENEDLTEAEVNHINRAIDWLNDQKKEEELPESEDDDMPELVDPDTIKERIGYKLELDQWSRSCQNSGQGKERFTTFFYGNACRTTQGSPRG